MHDEVQLRLNGGLWLKRGFFVHLSAGPRPSRNMERAKIGVGRVLKNIVNSLTSL